MADEADTGDTRRELDELFSVAYEELRRLASAVRRNDPSTTLSPTTLVNQAWMKLAASPRFKATSRLHFKRIAARAMRQVLVEAARRRHAGKRGGGGVPLSLDDSIADPVENAGELVALSGACFTTAEGSILV